MSDQPKVAEGDSPDMPFGKKSKPKVKEPTGEARKKLNHQQWVAENSPEPSYDLSGCDLEAIPHGVYPMCEALRKESLFLNGNRLTAVEDKKNPLEDLSELKIFDLHSNCITKLPSSLGSLRCLHVLNLEDNDLKELPESICNLSALQLLNVSRNKLSSLPSSFPNMKLLQSLDISNNRLKRLPTNFGLVRTLGVMSLDADKMMFPTSAVCAEGLEAIMKFLCKESGVEYIPPLKALSIANKARSDSEASNAKDSLQKYYEQMERDYKSYEGEQDRKRKEQLEFERHQLDIDQNMAEAAIKANNDRQKELMKQREDIEEYEVAVEGLFKERDAHNKAFLDDLRKADETTQQMIQDLLQSSERSRLREELLETLEEDQMKEAEFFKVKTEEYQALKKKELYDVMQSLLQEHRAYDEKLLEADRSRRAANERVKQSLKEEDEDLECILASHDKDKASMLNELVKQEEWQREAVESLMMQKDARHARLTSEITVVEQQLVKLSMKEAKNKELMNDMYKGYLEDQRRELMELFKRLIGERSEREIALHRRLDEMAAQREQDEVDFWLAQLQRLMDRKPAALLAREAGLIDQAEEVMGDTDLEPSVQRILESSGAAKYVHSFSQQRITMKVLTAMNEPDLEQIGVSEADLRRTIFKNTQAHATASDVQAQLGAAAKTRAIEQDDRRPPSAPSEDERTQPVQKETPQQEIVTRVSNECVICLDRESNIIFLNCGHVCTCAACSRDVQDCPLCRASIVQKVRLEIPKS